MKFANGMFGACICVIALLGTAIGGFVLNIEEDTREVTKYNQVADVSGLFTYEDAPEYIAYNPSSNYVGYSGDVNYTPSSTANNYRYIVAEGSTSTASTNVEKSSDYPGDYGSFSFGSGSTVQAPDVRFLWNGSIDFGSTTTVYGKQSNAIVRSIGTPIEDSKVHITRLTNVLDSLGANTSDNLDITITYNSTYPVLFYAGDWAVTQVEYGDGFFNSYHATLNENNSMPTRITVAVASNLATAYRGDTVIWQKTANDVGVIAWYNNKADGYTTSGVECSVTLNATIQESPTYGYMQPSAGVTATQTTATWSNGYDNSVIDLKFTKNGDSTRAQEVEIYIPNFETFRCYIQFFNSSGIHIVAYKDNTTQLTDEWVGKWLGIQMRIDALSGKIVFTPTNDVDLMHTVEPTDYSITLDDAVPTGTIQSFGVRCPGGSYDSMKFQVTDTMVFLNTYNTVMVNPTLLISDYFPSYEDYRLNFYSFAILGESMTINGQTCLVNKDNGTITFENVAGFEFTKKLENLYVTFNDGRTYLTFVNDDSTYDLGETTDTRISFSGMWYFTTSLYEITTGTEDYWNWDLSGFQASAGECLIIFLGIIAVGIIAYTVYGKGKLGLFDWLVIIFAVFIGSAMLGF